ncbi:MAG: hypothetical protein ACTSRS_00020 [Candidatus Helarchaeota archaeon]
MEITIVRNLNYLYFIFGLLLYLLVCSYVFVKRQDRQLLQIFFFGMVIGAGFELLMVLTGQRHLYIEGIGYNPFLSIIIGLFEINGTTTMAYVFVRKLPDKSRHISIGYLLLMSILLGSLPLFTQLFSTLSISWMTQPIISERPFELLSFGVAIFITVICFLILRFRLRHWKAILIYFGYLIIWGVLYVSILLLTGFRQYLIIDGADSLLVTFFLILNTIIFEVAGLMLVPLACNVLFNKQFHLNTTIENANHNLHNPN